MNFFGNRKFRLALFSIILIEELSFLGYLAPSANKVVFGLLVAAAIALAAIRLEWVVALVLAELAIGSKGYLFYLNISDFKISIRLALFAVVMAAWFFRSLVKLFREKNWGWPPGSALAARFERLKTDWPLIALALAVVWGAVNGLLVQSHTAGLVFFDFNAWLFFLLIVPLAATFKSRDDLLRFAPILSAALIWLAFKTLFTSYLFAHTDLAGPLFRFYRWIRTSGVGEVTLVKGGFYRVFFQSQIYLLLAYLGALLIFARRWSQSKFREVIKNGQNLGLAAAQVVFFAAILLSMSRSFWLGLAAGLLAIFVYVAVSVCPRNAVGYCARKLAGFAAWVAGTALAAMLLVIVIVNFPYPKPVGGFNAASLLSERASAIEEAAIISRWELLPELWREIREAPLLGQGFGKTITYQSQDPRQLESPNRGRYTAYAFEWGWLDILLKLGLAGLALYLALLAVIISRLKARLAAGANDLAAVLILSLAVLAVVHFFTPYLNHPLGISLVVLSYALSRPQALA